MNNITKVFGRLFLVFYLLTISPSLWAWGGMAMPELRVDGRYLKDPHGNIVNLHGFAQTYSPWFNEHGTQWSNYNVNGCLIYNKKKLNEVMNAGWKMNFVRMHMDPYWSNTPGVPTEGEHDISAFDFERFKTALDKVFIPMAEYAVSKGLYVVMRPPGVCPKQIAVGDDYNKYLLKVWEHVAQHPKLKNHPNIMFELANEPVNILGPNGDYASNSQGHFDNLKDYFQPVVEVMRAQGCDNILWIPGLAYQGRYEGFALNPIEGENIGYAVHLYPGWMGSDGENQDGGQGTGGGYEPFQIGWDEQVKPVADFAPVMITEMDWAPEKYNSSWGKALTGTAGGSGFGANMKKITDATGNVSWLIFTEVHLLAKFKDVAGTPGNYTFLDDPEACPWPTYHWYQEYAKVDYPRPDFHYRSYSDNGNGTYTNPVIFGDFPNPDVIRVGDIYYMVSTTMHIFPGATILKSYDLVNWEYCCNPLEKIDLSDYYNLENDCDRYIQKQWTTTLQYKDGKFYLLFSTFDEGGYLLTTTDVEGEWDMKKLNDTFDAPGLFFDEDGKTYIVYGVNTLSIAELDADFNKVPGSDKEVTTLFYGEGKGAEGSRLYKIDDYYYINATCGGWVGFRSENIYGPYEEKKLLDDDNIHQGALVQTQTGEWWTMLSYDKGAYGKLPNLQPVTWVEGWPEIAVSGEGVTTYQKPDVGRVYSITSLTTNDNFRNYKSGLQWGWNHNSDESKWSLIERPDYLRLKTASVTDKLHKAKNTLTQRILGYPQDLEHSYGTIKMEIDGMQEGDVAGLAVFQDTYAFIAVKMIDGQKKLVYATSSVTSSAEAEEQTGATIAESTIYLRAIANYNTSKASFYYSLDNETYTKFGNDFDMQCNPEIFTGNKFAIFNYATTQLGGYVDIDWFSTEADFEEDTFYDDSFAGYSEESLTLTGLVVEGGNNVTLLTGSPSAIIVKAVYADGHSEDVTMDVECNNQNPEILRIRNGRIMSLKDGEAVVTFSYKGAMGEPQSTTINITSTTFPLTNALFNPSIYGAGTFNETTKTLITGQWGFGGWQYSQGVDLSEYNYVVATLGSDNKCGVSFRLYDESSYWTSPCINDFGNKRQVMVDLHNAKKDNGVKLNPSHIYIVGFWSNGGVPFVIKNVYLTNTDPNSIDSVTSDSDPLVDVYTITGIKLRSQVVRSEAIEGLAPGIYIVGKEKIAILK